MEKPKLTLVSADATTEQVYLTAAAVSSLIHTLPSGTAYFIGIVLIVMMTGRLVQHKGSLARAAFPFVAHLRWGWHRVERAMERGKVPLDELIESAYAWSLNNLEVEEVRLGVHQRLVHALDTTTIARWRCQSEKVKLVGKGYYHRAKRAIKANLCAALVSVAMIGGQRVPLLRAVKFGTSEESAVALVFQAVQKLEGYHLIIVDAKIATKEQFAQASAEKALAGRLRINCVLRCQPQPRPNKKNKQKKAQGRPPKHGALLHPGSAEPEVKPDEDFTLESEGRTIRIRRWNHLHFEEHAETKLDVLRIDDPKYKDPLLVGTTARELTTAELIQVYPHRWPVETLFYIGAETTGTEKPRAWTEQATERRIGLGLMSASLLKAIAAGCAAIAIGPWDKKPQPTAGRLADHLDLHAAQFQALSLKGAALRNYRKNPNSAQTKDLGLKKAA
jgi:hypothetical protein